MRWEKEADVAVPELMCGFKYERLSLPLLKSHLFFNFPPTKNANLAGLSAPAGGGCALYINFWKEVYQFVSEI